MQGKILVGTQNNELLEIDEKNGNVEVLELLCVKCTAGGINKLSVHYHLLSKNNF